MVLNVTILDLREPRLSFPCAGAAIGSAAAALRCRRGLGRPYQTCIFSVPCWATAEQLVAALAAAGEPCFVLPLSSPQAASLQFWQQAFTREELKSCGKHSNPMQRSSIEANTQLIQDGMASILIDPTSRRLPLLPRRSSRQRPPGRSSSSPSSGAALPPSPPAVRGQDPMEERRADVQWRETSRAGSGVASPQGDAGGLVSSASGNGALRVASPKDGPPVAGG